MDGTILKTPFFYNENQPVITANNPVFTLCFRPFSNFFSNSIFDINALIIKHYDRWNISPFHSFLEANSTKEAFRGLPVLPPTLCFNLNVGGFYWGRLRLSEFDNNWYFDPTPKTQGLEALVNDFADLVVAWYE